MMTVMLSRPPRPFAFAMTIGIVVGTYSSIYIAAPTLMLLEARAAAAPTARASAPPSKGQAKGAPKKPRPKKKARA